jgi:glycine cleavage system regulatory protein
MPSSRKRNLVVMVVSPARPMLVETLAEAAHEQRTVGETEP